MTALRTLISLTLLAFAAAASAQSTGEGLRGSTPPGSAQDGAAPSQGAIKGGSILPGESAGMPNGTAKQPTTEGLKRCYELSGTLREQCLLQESGASTGGTRDSTEKPAGPVGRDPLTEPPPRNPPPLNAR